MILFDTDHLSIFKYPGNPKYSTLIAHMQASFDQQIATTIISVEEQWRGWFAVIARHRDVRRQVKAYQELVSLHSFLNEWTIIPF
jgi:tRNA(fMet)-specific endonuclease VapC